MTFSRFPRTPHLIWIGDRSPRSDKVLTPHEVESLLADIVTVEEKVDGANIGFSVDSTGILRVQNRGSYLSLETSHPQFKLLTAWIEPRRRVIVDALSPHLMLFGEWCYAVHSVKYTKLPDWFLMFDVYDRNQEFFWSVSRRDDLARRLEVEVVPRLATGRFDLDEIVQLLGPSKLGDGPAEGLYVRRDESGRLVARAKLVRAEFVQGIQAHWSHRSLQTNTLARKSAVGGNDRGAARR